MRALLLAAGFGTRLLPITRNKPKCLVEINGRPLLDIWLEKITSCGVTEILVNTHYLADVVRDYVLGSQYRQYIQLRYEEELLGTCGTVLSNLDFIDQDSLLLIHADNLSFFSMDEFLTAHKSRPNHCDITMMTFQTDDPETCGVVVTDVKGVVCQFFEKVKNPPSNIANGAVYIIENELIKKLKYFDPLPRDFSTEVLPKLVGEIYTFHNSVYHRDIGTPSSLRKAQEEIKEIKFDYL